MADPLNISGALCSAYACMLAFFSSFKRLKCARRGGDMTCIMQASTAKLLKETCSYIKSLQREVDDLSDRLSDLLSTMDHNSPAAEIIRSILRS
jgi:hypothetical protein